MNRCWIVVAVLIAVSLTTPDSVNADGALRHVEISKGINPKRRLGIPGTIEQGFSWAFENQKYTVLIAIDARWYNQIRSYKRQRQYNFYYLLPIVQEGTKSLQDLIREFSRIMPRTWNAEQKVTFVLTFVQSLPYTKDIATGYDEYYKYPIETLAESEDSGDCEDTSVLFASLLNGLNFKVALIALPGHIAVGVKGNFHGTFFPHENNKYFYCETTRTGWNLGVLPPEFKDREYKVIPIASIPIEPKVVKPQVEPPNLNPPEPLSPRETLEKGIKLYEQARYNEAIKSLRSALDRLGDPGKQAEAYLYLGCSKRGFGEANEKVKEQFQNAVRHNPDQKLPPRIGEDHPVFGPLFEEVREELTGELTVTSLRPKTKIWIDGNGIDKKMLGTGTVSRRLFKGGYTVEGIYEGGSKKKTVTIEPNVHKELDLEIPPIVRHDPPAKISIGDIIPLTLDLISSKGPQWVKIYYKIYDRGGNELEQNNREMRLWDKQPASLKWIYKVGLPSQKYAGSIEYYIEIGYENHLTFKYPETEGAHYRIPIVDGKPPAISLLDPPDGAKFKVNQQITIRAEAIDNISVKEVYIHFSPVNNQSQKLSREGTSGIYTVNMTFSQAGFVRYYLIATDDEGNEGKSESRNIEVEPPEPPPREPEHQGIWVSIAANNASASDWDEGNTFRLAYLREGKTHPTLGARLDVSQPDRTNVNAIVQWGPALENSNIGLTFLGGIAEYEDSPRSTHMTPILGAGLKFYPRDKIAIDTTSSIKFRSDFDTTNLYHYEVGIRFYITRQLSLRAGYGKLYLGNRDLTTMQIGLGYTF